ncbi:hypothetical protein H5410_045519 [Solanum commersonii]|uniref:DUF7746 domain-containing protein n=1 Tax=Solanum commersonii TaxID=4109 RepID=A0A9J5XBV1_SOLCO|nr:hypothetical protein H5410_045519 [Solanum commersonii]
MGSIESTVSYGPIYFNTQPNLQLSLTDSNILDALTLNVKTHGYNYALGSELICLSYRIYFKLLATLNPRYKLYDTFDQTILVETNFAKSKVTTRRPIKWEEINFPTTWTLDSVIPPEQRTAAVTNFEYSHITQNANGKICIQFDEKSVPYNRHSFSSDRRLLAIQHISPIDPSCLYVKVLGEHISSLDNKLDDMMILIGQIKNDLKPSEQASSSKQPDVPIQRPPEIQDFIFKPLYDLENLLDKKFSQFGAKSISLSEDFADEMETTFDFKNQVELGINKLRGYPKKNNGFTGQLRGWWDNYMSTEAKAAVINAKAANEGIDNLGFALVKNREDAVYTLVLTILEHFNGRFTNQYETVCSLLNGLRCRHLGKFRWYKDTYLSRVMELPENGLEHWKAKFIDGLPPLFAERVRKTLRNSQGVIPYDSFTYGKLIGACTQEDSGKQTKHRDSRDSNPDKPHRKRRSRRRSREEREERRTHRFETDKPETSGNTQSTTTDACKCRGDICSCEHDGFYKLQSQFEDLNMYNITSYNVIELLKEITDNTLREKIIQLAANNNANLSNIVEKSKNEFEYASRYSLSKVNNILSNQHVVIRDTSFDDLKGEIDQLKQEIKSLKQN